MTLAVRPAYMDKAISRPAVLDAEAFSRSHKSYVPWLSQKFGEGDVCTFEVGFCKPDLVPHSEVTNLNQHRPRPVRARSPPHPVAPADMSASEVCNFQLSAHNLSYDLSRVFFAVFGETMEQENLASAAHLLVINIAREKLHLLLESLECCKGEGFEGSIVRSDGLNSSGSGRFLQLTLELCHTVMQ